jgi:ribosomal-protein-alanine N-acetyltransferase
MSPAGTDRFPDLSTPRLKLRDVRSEDSPAFMELLSFYIVTRFSDWPDAPSQDQCETFVREMTEAYQAGRGCGWAIEDAESGTMIGAIRINYILPNWKCGGIGYELHPGFWNKGLMTEALCAVVECAHGHFQLNRLEAWTLAGNAPSERVLAKAGFALEGTQRQRGFFKGAFHDFRIFGRVATDPIAG